MKQNAFFPFPLRPQDIHTTKKSSTNSTPTTKLQLNAFKQIPLKPKKRKKRAKNEETLLRYRRIQAKERIDKSQPLPCTTMGMMYFGIVKMHQAKINIEDIAVAYGRGVARIRAIIKESIQRFDVTGSYDVFMIIPDLSDSTKVALIAKELKEHEAKGKGHLTMLQLRSLVVIDPQTNEQLQASNSTYWRALEQAGFSLKKPSKVTAQDDPVSKTVRKQKYLI